MKMGIIPQSFWGILYTQNLMENLPANHYSAYLETTNSNHSVPCTSKKFFTNICELLMSN